MKKLIKRTWHAPRYVSCYDILLRRIGNWEHAIALHTSPQALEAMVSEIYMVPFALWKDVEQEYRSGEVFVEIRSFLMSRVYALVPVFT